MITILFLDDINEIKYQAEMAYLKSDLEWKGDFIDIEMLGFNDSMPNFI